MASTREGYWQTTFTGLRVYPLDPKPEDFCIEDIAHGLSNACRWGGQCGAFYSVAEHCVRGSHMATDPLHALEFLLHDASEAYYGDPTRPLLKLLPDLEMIHFRTQCCINTKFGVARYGDQMSPECRTIDERMMISEAQHLFLHSDKWWTAPGFAQPYDDLFIATRGYPRAGVSNGEPQPKAAKLDVEAWPPRMAKRLFLERFKELNLVIPPPPAMPPPFPQAA